VSVIVAILEEAEVVQRFDNVFLVHTLEHIDDPVAVLARIRNWLSAGGRLFVAVPNANALSRQIAVKMGLIEYNSAVTAGESEHGHRRTYSLDVLLSQLRHAGLPRGRLWGVLVKPLANFQFDRALEQGIIDEAYLDACHELARSIRICRQAFMPSAPQRVGILQMGAFHPSTGAVAAHAIATQWRQTSAWRLPPCQST